MAINFLDKSGEPTPTPKKPTKGKSGHAKPIPIDKSALLKPGRLRPGHLMHLYGISHSTLYKRREAGLIPKPDLTEHHRPIWFTSTIAPFFGVKSDG